MKKICSYGLAVFAVLGLFFSRPVPVHATGTAELRARLQRLGITPAPNQGRADSGVKLRAASFGGAVLASTYLGGSDIEGSVLNKVFATSVAVGPNGDVYVAGFTDSNNTTQGFPVSAALNPAQSAYGGARDAFVARFDQTLSTLRNATYLGGSAADAATALVIDINGNVYVAGYTSSTGAGPSAFPTTAGAFSTAPGGGVDAFVSKLSADLTTLLASTFLGGAGNDHAYAIAINGSDVLVAGDTDSADLATNGTTYGGGVDAFAAKLNANLAAPVALTYLGGTGNDGAGAIAFHDGSILVAGDTSSPDISSTNGATHGGGIDAFAAKLDNASLLPLAFTYIGGTGDELAYALAVNAAGNIFLAGETTSPGLATAGAYSASKKAGVDAFAAKLDNANLASIAITYLGGAGNDQAYSLAANGANIYVAGDTTSSDFPVTAGSFRTASGGGSDVFISRLNDSLTELSASTYMGGSGNDYANAVALDMFGNVYVAGFTFSQDLPTSANAYQAGNFGFSDAFVSEFDAGLSVPSAIPDTQAPTVPANLTASAASEALINLAWTASTDNVGVLGYEVWRGAEKIATVIAPSYSDSGLSAGTPYTYKVKAFDAANNVSAFSNPATATTLAPGVIGGGDAGGGDAGGGSDAGSGGGDGKKGKGGCFIATAAYGSYMADDVMVLRRFRDEHLLTNAAGRAFVSLYYAWSPPLADFIAGHETLRTATRAALSPLVYGIKRPAAALILILLFMTAGAALSRRNSRFTIMAGLLAVAVTLTGLSCRKQEPAAAPPSPVQKAETEEVKKGVDEAKKTLAARVNGVDITMLELVREMNRIAPQYIAADEKAAPETTEKIREEALDNLVTTELAVQEAIRQGIAVSPGRIDEVVLMIKKQAGAEKAYRQYLDGLGITESELRERIERGHRYELIVAKEVYGKIRIDENDSRAAYELQKGEFEDAAGRRISYEEAAPIIKRKLLSEIGAVVKQEWGKSLRKNAKIVVFANTAE